MSTRILTLGAAAGRVHDVKQVSEIGGMLLFILENSFQEHAGGGVVVGKMANHFGVDLDDNALGNQVFADHVGQGFSLDVLRSGALQQVAGIKVGLAAELLDAFGNAISVLAFGIGVLLELAGNRFAVYAGGHKVVVHVAEDAHDFGSQGLVQNFNGLFFIAAVGVCDGSIFDAAAGTLAELLNVFDKLRHIHLTGNCLPDKNGCLAQL